MNRVFLGVRSQIGGWDWGGSLGSLTRPSTGFGSHHDLPNARSHHDLSIAGLSASTSAVVNPRSRSQLGFGRASSNNDIDSVATPGMVKQPVALAPEVSIESQTRPHRPRSARPVAGTQSTRKPLSRAWSSNGHVPGPRVVERSESSSPSPPSRASPKPAADAAAASLTDEPPSRFTGELLPPIQVSRHQCARLF